MEKRSILNNQKRSHSSLMRVVSSNIFWETLNHPPKKKRFQNPFEPSSRCRNESRLIKSLQCELKPDTGVPKSDLSSETGASLAIYLCGNERKKKKHKVALSRRSVWYAAAGPPELRDTATTESRDFKSSQCPPPPASETAGRTHQALFSVRSHPCVSVVPTNHRYSEHQNPLHALFGKKKVLCNDWHETKIRKFFICLSNTLQELQSGDFRGSFSFFQLWLQRMSCMLTLKPNLNGRKSEWRRNRKWREGGERSDKDRLQICVAVPPLINRTFNICLCPYTKDTASVFVRISHKPLRENHLIGGIKKIVWCRVHQLKKQRNSQIRKGRT